MLAIVIVDGETTSLRYVREPFAREPDFGVTSVNYDLDDLWGRGQEPAPAALLSETRREPAVIP